MNKLLPAMLGAVTGYTIRFFPGAVAACLLILPAYKGLWAGYVPLALGVAGGLWAWRHAGRWEEQASAWSPARMVSWIYGVPALVQVLLVTVMRSHPSFDGLFVLRHAETLLVSGQMDPMTYYPPAQTWWYAGWFHVFGPSFMVAQLSQIPLAMGVTWVTLQLARRVTGEEGLARLAALGVAWYPGFLGYVLTTPYYHYLYTFMSMLMAWLLVAAINRETSWSRNGFFLLAGLFAGLGALTKAVHLIAPLQAGAWLVLLAVTGHGHRLRWGRLIAALFVFTAGMIAVLAPWMMRNHRVFDEWVPVCTSGGLVLYSANNPDSNGLYSPTPDKAEISTPKEMLHHSRWCSAQARTFIREQPVDFLRLAVIKFLHTWGVEATFTELINWRGEYRGWIKPGFSFLFFGGWAALVAIWLSTSVTGVRSGRAVEAFELLAGVVILSNAAVYVVFEGGDRHHLPLVPLVIILLAAGLARRTSPPGAG